MHVQPVSTKCMTELLRLAPDTTQFDCDIRDDQDNVIGIETYYIEDQLSIARFRQMQKFQREVATGLTHFDLIQLLKNNVTNLNEAMAGGKVLAQMSYENINALNGSGNIENKEPFAVWLCTLIINTKQEDRRVFDVPTMQTKIRIWERNGIDVSFFLSVAEGLLGLPTGAFRLPTLTYLEPLPNESSSEASGLNSEGQDT